MGGFLVLEGIDGSGTTTHASLLAQALEARGHEVVRTAEPTDGVIGRLIREKIRARSTGASLATLPWLFAADRAEHLEQTILPALSRGAWVICDRYVPSSLAYQALDHTMQSIARLNESFRIPDCTILLEVTPEVGLARVERRGSERDLFEKLETLAQIVTNYEAALAWVQAQGGLVKRVETSRTIPEIAADLLAIVDEITP